MIPFEIRKLLAFGTGVGIEIGEQVLTASIVRVRPSASHTVATLTIADFENRPAAEWGAEYAAFLKKHGARHLAAHVLLPRRELVVRHLAMPGVGANDLGAAISFQLDSLHPYGDQEVASAWTRLDKGPDVLIGITRRQVIDKYTALFAEAGIKVASLTFSAAALYSVFRQRSQPRANFVAFAAAPEGVEVYGESSARPVFSALFETSVPRAVSLAAAELRLPPDTEPIALETVAPTLAGAAASCAACPGLAFQANLLPEDQRTATSRVMFIPTIALTVILLGLGIALALQGAYEDRRYAALVNAEIAKLQPQAGRVASLDKAIEKKYTQARQLDDFRRRSKADMDALAELTKLLAPPIWLNSLELSRESVVLAGEAEQAAPLLQVIDNSPLFQGSEFNMPIAKVQNAEAFRIRALREGSR